MKYQAPFGITDPNAVYVNGNPQTGILGSIPPAGAFEFPMREIVNLITASGLSPNDADLQQLLKAVRSQRVNYSQDTGSVNNYSIAFSPPVDSYTPGIPFHVRILNT